LHLNTHACCFSLGLDAIDPLLLVKGPMKLFIAFHYTPKPARRSKI